MPNDNTKDYIEYLRRYTRTLDMTIWQAHQLALSREVAKEYGLTDDDVQWLDDNI